VKHQPYDADAIAERVRQVLDRDFGGNQTVMAKKIGCASSLISLIVNKAQKPGRSFLTRMTTLPGVSASWLLSGITTDLPLVRHISAPDLTTRESIHVAYSLDIPSDLNPTFATPAKDYAYAGILPQDIRAGDVIIFGRPKWLSSAHRNRLDGKWCLIEWESALLTFAEVKWDSASRKLLVRDRDDPKVAGQRGLRHLDLGDGPVGTPAKHCKPVKLNQVIAVAIEFRRKLCGQG
jgi:hypothetical protein